MITYLKNVNIVIKLILSIEIVALIILTSIVFKKWNGEYIVPSSIDFWSSRGIEYDEGWYADEGLVEKGIVLPGESTEVLFGPYIRLEKGNYLISIEYEANQDQSFVVCAFEQNDKIECNDTILPYNSLEKTSTENTSIVTREFALSDEIENAEVRIAYSGYGFIRIKNITIVKSAYKYRNILKLFLLVIVGIDVFIGLIVFVKINVIVRKGITYIAPMLLYIALIGYDISYVLLNGQYYIDKSMSKYPGLALILFRSVFSSNWILARAIFIGCGIVIYSLLFIAISCQLGSDIRYAILLATILIMPFSIANIKMITFGTHQLLEGIVSLLLIYLVLKTKVYEKNYCVVSILCVVVTTITYLVKPLFILDYDACKYSGYQIISGMTGGKLFELIGAVLSIFSWHQSNIMAYKGTYNSEISNIGQHPLNSLAFFVVALLSLYIIGIKKNQNQLPLKEKFVFALMMWMLVLNSIITLCYVGNRRFGYYYWIHIIPVLLLIIEIWGKYQLKRNCFVNVIIIVCIFFVLSIVSVRDFQSEPGKAYPELKHLSDFLDNNGYTRGYSVDDYSYVIEELSNGNIRRECNENSNNTEFVVKRRGDNDSYIDSAINKDCHIVYENSSGFCVYEIDY